MDSKAVDQMLRAVLWPALKQEGFRRRTGRTAWRDRGVAVQCVNVQSFNSYKAEGLGATTYSFAINVGVFFEAIATRSARGAFIRDLSRPQEPACHLRKAMTKGFAQPNLLTRPRFGIGRGRPSLGSWVDRPDIWLVLPDGSNVEIAVRDAKERVLAEGLPWLDTMSEPRRAIERLLAGPPIIDGPPVIYGAGSGKGPGPASWHAIAALAAAGGDWDLVQRAVDQMATQSYWQDNPRDLDGLRAELNVHKAAGS